MSSQATTVSFVGRYSRPSSVRARPLAEVGERAAATVMLAVAAPAISILAVAIAVLSRRPPFVTHLRAGRHGRPLRMLKLRTMWGGQGATTGPWSLVEHIADDHGPLLKSASDARVSSRLARFCRRYSLDELPQLWHVARGEMALVGPRPITKTELEMHYGEAAAEVLALKPGLTGLWQVLGRSALSYPQRRRLDLFLVRRFCWRLYFKILFRTFPAVLAARDSV